MSNSFTVTTCSYDGTSGDPNPICFVVGSVNGNKVFAATFYRYLMAASAAGQLQSALTAVMFNWYVNVYGFEQTPWPSPIPFPQFSPSNADATPSFGPYPVPPVSVPQALIGSWTA
jgi:hypothetical protein